MRDRVERAILAVLLIVVLWFVFLSLLVARWIEKRLDALQQTTTVVDAPASGGEGA